MTPTVGFPRGVRGGGSVVKARRRFLQGVGVLVLFTLAREVGLPGPPGAGIAVLTAVLVVIAGAAGASLDDLGLDPARAWAGLRWGGVAFDVVLVVLLLVAAIPATGVYLQDPRAQIDGGLLVREVLLGIVLAPACRRSSPSEACSWGLL